MARHMAGDARQFRAVVTLTYLGPDQPYTNPYTQRTTYRHRHGDYYQTIYGPYPKAATAKGTATQNTSWQKAANETAMRNGQPEPWKIEVVIQEATIDWKDI